MGNTNTLTSTYNSGLDGGKVTGMSMITIANFLASRLEWCIAEAERIKGSPPNTPEIVCVFHHNYTSMINNGYLTAFLQNLFREDRFYTDKQFSHYSMTGPDGTEERKTFEKFSEKFQRLFPGYLLDKF